MRLTSHDGINTKQKTRPVLSLGNAKRDDKREYYLPFECDAEDSHFWW
jgi:hypothetical protein